MKRSSVAILIREREKIFEVLMIKRAERLGDPWSGHMAFPGGRRDRGDKNSFTTAIRETSEEVGICLPECARYLGRLSDQKARSSQFNLGMLVTPFIFFMIREEQFRLNYEVASSIWIPLDFFANPKNREVMVWSRGSFSMEVPCYKYDKYCVWGLSLSMLMELIAALPSR